MNNEPKCGELVQLRLFGGEVVERVFLFSIPRSELWVQDASGVPDLAFLRHQDGVSGGHSYKSAMGYGPVVVAKAKALGLEDVDNWVLTFDMSQISRIPESL